MKVEMGEHLLKIQKAVAEADRILALHTYAGDSRTVTVTGLFSTMVQHHGVMLWSYSRGLVSSCFSLGRLICESMYRVLWINACATPEQIESIGANDKFSLSMPAMTKAIDEMYKADRFLET